MKEKLGKIILPLFFVVLVLYLAITGIMDLTNSKDIHSVTIDAGMPLLEVEHSINGLIPIGTEYYYLGVNEDTSEAYIVHSSKGWLKDNFTDDYMTKTGSAMTITGLAKRVTDFDTETELGNRISQMQGASFPLGIMSLELNYKTTAILRLVLAIAAIILLIGGIYFVKNKGNVNKYFGIGYILTVLLWAFLLLIVLR